MYMLALHCAVSSCRESASSAIVTDSVRVPDGIVSKPLAERCTLRLDLCQVYHVALSPREM